MGKYHWSKRTSLSTFLIKALFKVIVLCSRVPVVTLLQTEFIRVETVHEKIENSLEENASIASFAFSRNLFVYITRGAASVTEW